MSDVRCLSSDVRCPLCDIRCAMSNVCCLMSDVRCQVYTFSLFFWLQVLGPLAGNTLFTEDDFKLLESFDMDLYARKVRDQVCLSSAIIIEDCIYKHIRCGMLHRQSSVKTCFLLLILSFCITINVSLRAFIKNKLKKMFLVRISIKKRVGGRIFFSLFALFNCYQSNAFFTSCYSPPPPPGIS